MSTKSLDYSNLDLLNPSSTQASWHALAFCRTPGVRALGAPGAHVLHARVQPSRRVRSPRPPGLCSLAEPRPSSSTRQNHPSPLAPYSAAVRSAMAASGRPQQPLPWTAPPKPHARAICPWNSSSSSASSSASARRRHVAMQQQNGGSPSSLSPAAAEPTLAAYKRTPELLRTPRPPQPSL